MGWSHSIFNAMAVTQIPFDQVDRNSPVVFFTGAGISSESGISTFRDLDGHWSKYDPMNLASPDGFISDPELVLDWYAARRKAILEAEPNAGHRAISDFQKLFKESLVITQNVDGLHILAGSKPVLELHGNIHRHKCFECSSQIELSVHEASNLNYCSCGGLVRPDVVWFGESLVTKTLEDAFQAVQDCQIFFTVGTSTQIYPAAQLPFEAKNNQAFVIEVNPEVTPFSSHAHMSLRAQAGEALPQLYEEFYAKIS